MVQFVQLLDYFCFRGKLVKAYARKYPRLNVRVAVEYAAGGETYRSTASTLSGGGLFLSTTEGLEPGTEILVHFRPAKHLPLITAKAKVLYTRENKGAAVEFIEITPEDRQRLLRLIHQKTADKRLLPRAPLATQVLCNEGMALALSRDISLGGMFIEMDVPPPVGSPIQVRFNLDTHDRVITASAHVAYHIQKMGMGIHFTEVGAEDLAAIQEYVLATVPKPGGGIAENQSVSRE